MVWLRLVFSVRAAALGIYPISSAMARIRFAVSGLISGMALSALLTVATEHPQRAAISLSVVTCPATVLCILNRLSPSYTLLISLSSVFVNFVCTISELSSQKTQIFQKTNVFPRFFT